MKSLLRGVALARRLPLVQVSLRLNVARSSSTSSLVPKNDSSTPSFVPKSDLGPVYEGSEDMLDCPRLGDAPTDVIQKKVRIFQPSRKVMQSSSKPGQWRLEFPREKYFAYSLGQEMSNYHFPSIACCQEISKPFDGLDRNRRYDVPDGSHLLTKNQTEKIATISRTPQQLID